MLKLFRVIILDTDMRRINCTVDAYVVAKDENDAVTYVSNYYNRGQFYAVEYIEEIDMTKPHLL